MLCYVSPAHSFFLRHKQLQTKWYIKNGTIFKFNSCIHLLSRVNFEKLKQGFLLNDYLMTNRNLRKATKTARKNYFVTYVHFCLRSVVPLIRCAVCTQVILIMSDWWQGHKGLVMCSRQESRGSFFQR